ncbi:hypothetical protein DPX16_22397 [Anabarilius grahami]|uniref:Uncharacterized protein n=1 Tax=Anabarilius grahami TaxID=495550 RepID=A0A3N0YZ04_ANAGA|nr:hypothetical protein DPX16_22397 [Anabarilius grahami]
MTFRTASINPEGRLKDGDGHDRRDSTCSHRACAGAHEKMDGCVRIHITFQHSSACVGEKISKYIANRHEDFSVESQYMNIHSLGGKELEASASSAGLWKALGPRVFIRASVTAVSRGAPRPCAGAEQTSPGERKTHSRNEPHPSPRGL